MKKVISLLLIVIALFTLASCGKTETNPVVIEEGYYEEAEKVILYSDKNTELTVKTFIGANMFNFYSFKSITLTLIAENKTDKAVKYTIKDVKLNGKPAEATLWDENGNVVEIGAAGDCRFDIDKTNRKDGDNELTFVVVGSTLDGEEIFKTKTLKVTATYNVNTEASS